MAKRLTAVGLWFMAIWMLYGFASLVVALPDLGGPVLAALAAAVVGIDPTRRLWVASAA